MVYHKNRVVVHNTHGLVSSFGTEYPMHDANFCDFTTALNRLYASAGLDSDNPVIVSDGPAWHIVTAETSAGFKLSCVTIANHKGIMYAGNTMEADGRKPARLRWSAFGEPENFSPYGAGSYLAFCDVGDVDEPILKIFSFQNDLVILKRKTVWVASGVASNEQGDITPGNLRCINTEFGVTNPKACAAHSDGVYMIADSGVWMINGNMQFKKIDKDFWQLIEGLPRDRWQTCALENDVANGILYLGFPTFGHQNEFYLIRNPTGKWTRWTFPKNMSCVRAVVDNVGVYHLYFGDYDDGVSEVVANLRTDFGAEIAIASTYETEWIDLQKSTLLRSLEVMIRQEGSHTMYVDVYHDLSQTPHETVIISESAGDPTLGTMQTPTPLTGPTAQTAQYASFYALAAPLNGHARRVKFKFRTADQFDRFNILQVKVGYIPRSGI